MRPGDPLTVWPEAAHVWHGDHGVATGGSVPPSRFPFPEEAGGPCAHTCGYAEGQHALGLLGHRYEPFRELAPLTVARPRPSAALLAAAALLAGLAIGYVAGGIR